MGHGLFGGLTNIEVINSKWVLGFNITGGNEYRLGIYVSR
jgi:hypothetical protein